MLGALAIEKLVRLRIVYAVSIVLFGAIAAIALKVALRSRWQAQDRVEPFQYIGFVGKAGRQRTDADQPFATGQIGP